MDKFLLAHWWNKVVRLAVSKRTYWIWSSWEHCGWDPKVKAPLEEAQIKRLGNQLKLTEGNILKLLFN